MTRDNGRDNPRSGLEHGQGYISYPNGNSLDAEFVAGKIMGHGVFRGRDDP